MHGGLRHISIPPMNHRGISEYKRRAPMFANATMVARARPPRVDRYLLGWTVAHRTLKRYHSSVRKFVDWCHSIDADAFDADSLDELLAEYFHWSCDNDGTKSNAASTLYGIRLIFPQFQFRLPVAAACLRGWSKRTLADTRPPLTWSVTVAIAYEMARLGQWRMGVGMLLSFDCLLRAGEMLAITHDDVVDDIEHDSRRDMDHKGMALRLAKTKTGGNRSVEVLELSVIQSLRIILSRTSPGERLFPFSYTTYRNYFVRARDNLGLDASFTTHSLRHGGATRYYHIHKWPIDDVIKRGRWANAKTATRYIQTFLGILISMRVPKAVATLGHALSLFIVRWLIDSPPRQ